MNDETAGQKGRRFLVDASLSGPRARQRVARRRGMKDLQTRGGGRFLWSLFDYLGPGPETTLLSRRSIGSDVLGRYAVLEAVLGPKRSNPIKVESNKSEPKQGGCFHSPEDSKESPAQIHEGTLERRVHRLDDLAPSHRDAPGRRAVGNALRQGELHRGNRQDSRAAARGLLAKVHKKRVPRSPHRLWDLTASQ